MRRFFLSAACAAALAAALAACGSSDSSDSSSTAHSGSAATAAATTSAPAPTGEPIRVGVIGELDTGAAGGTQDPEWAGAVEARVKAINAAGGINGRPVDVLTCNTALDPNKATACAREAVEKGVVAEIGMDSNESAQIVPILEKAGIPLIGPVPIDDSILTSDLSFPITAGVPGAFMGMPALLAQQGAKKVSLIYPNLPNAAPLVKLFEAAVQKNGMTVTGTVAVPLTTTDLTPSVAAATKNGTDGIVAFLVGQAQGTLLTTIKQQGFSGPVATAAAFLSPALLDSLGSQLDGTFVVGFTRPATSSSPGIDMFLRDMKAFDASLPTSDVAANNWAATWVFERVAAKLDDVTAASVAKAMGQITDMDMGGIVPPLTTTKAAKVVPGVTRMFNPTVVFEKLDGGELVPLADGKDVFTNPFA